jgi:ATP-dependent Clp protease protease subunit
MQYLTAPMPEDLLLQSRIVFLQGVVRDSTANDIITRLLYLESVNSQEDITLYINSPGGVVTAGLAIFDIMRHIKPDIATVCVGQAASMGSFLLAAGTKGKRFTLPSARIMIHQPSGGALGTAADIRVQAGEITRLEDYLNKNYSNFTKKPLSVIKKAMERDNFMDAAEAKAFGLVDKIITRKQIK